MSGEHHEKEYTIVQMAFNLFCACIVSGIIIATVFYFTNPYAIESEKQLKIMTMKQLVPEAESFEPVEGKEGWNVAIVGGEKTTYIVPVVTAGFSGHIEMMVAISEKDSSVVRYSVVAHKETPGLGDKADKSPFKDQFEGITKENLVVTKDPSQTDYIQALTGATITSRAVVKNVVEAIDEVNAYKGGTK